MSGLDPSSDDVIREAELIVDPVTKKIASSELWLHEHGYHAYSTALCNMRVKIERAYSDLVDELLETN